MIVEDFIKWLQTQDQGATIEVLVGERRDYAGGYNCHKVDFDPEKHVYVVDNRGYDLSCEHERSLFIGDACGSQAV